MSLRFFYNLVHSARTAHLKLVRETSNASFDGFTHAKRLSVRRMQIAHALFWKWLYVLAKIHLKHPDLGAEAVIKLSLPYVPEKRQRNAVRLLYPLERRTPVSQLQRSEQFLPQSKVE